MTAEASEDRWICRHPDALVLKSWPEGSVVYDAADSSLHALTAVAAELLALMLDGAEHTPDDLARRMLQDTPEADEVDGVRQQLLHFEHLGLLERVGA